MKGFGQQNNTRGEEKMSRRAKMVLDVYYDENVPLFRRNVYRKSGAMILRVRSRDTALK